MKQENLAEDFIIRNFSIDVVSLGLYTVLREILVLLFNVPVAIYIIIHIQEGIHEILYNLQTTENSLNGIPDYLLNPLIEVNNS